MISLLQQDFIVKNFKGMTDGELAEELLISVSQVRRFLRRKNLKRRNYRIYTEEAVAIVRKFASAKDEIIKVELRKAGFDFSLASIAKKRVSLGLRKPKGRPKNKQVFTRSDGAKAIYVQGKERRLSRYNYEKFFGEIPEGYVVVFRDENPSNCAPENLEIISKSKLTRIRRKEAKNLNTANFRAARDSFNNLVKDYNLLAAGKYDEELTESQITEQKKQTLAKIQRLRFVIFALPERTKPYSARGEKIFHLLEPIKFPPRRKPKK